MAWKWIVRRTRESKPFFFAFATICGVVPGVVGYCVMQATNTRSDQLESQLRSKARPESLASQKPFIIIIVIFSKYYHSFLFIFNFFFCFLN